MLRILSLAAFVAIVLCTFSTTKADVLINGYGDATNDRFTNSNQFIAGGYNLSGVGQSDAGWWATLISRNVIVSAFHAQPGGNISFFSNNNPATSPVVRQVVSSTQIGTSDLWVATLNQDVTPNISHYNFATNVLTGPPAPNQNNFNISSAGPYQDLNAFMFGRSPADHPENQDQAVGRNLIGGYAEEVFFNGGNTDAIITRVDAPNTPNFVQYETQLVGGDSGAPLFVDMNGSLLLLGVNSFIATNSSNVVVANGSTYIGNYAQQIQNYVNVAAVPEPSSVAAVGLAAVALAQRYRRAIALKRVA